MPIANTNVLPLHGTRKNGSNTRLTTANLNLVLIYSKCQFIHAHYSNVTQLHNSHFVFYNYYLIKMHDLLTLDRNVILFVKTANSDFNSHNRIGMRWIKIFKNDLMCETALTNEKNIERIALVNETNIADSVNKINMAKKTYLVKCYRRRHRTERLTNDSYKYLTLLSSLVFWLLFFFEPKINNFE